MNDTFWYILAAEIIVLMLLYFSAKKWTWSRHIMLSLFLIVNAVYLFWRAAETIPTIGIISFIAGILLLATEVMGYFQAIMFTILSWRPFKRKHIPLSELESLPTVDVFIATYNEPEDLLKRTMIACTMMRYPEDLLKVYVCDDGKRESVRRLAESLGVGYISRPGNKHAKAGNLNDALTKTDGEVVVTMDADMVPKAEFLERTLGQFTDEKVSFVQAPQVFYNADPFQYNLFFEDNITNEQDFFMRRLEEGKDRFNATMYVGSNALFRRKSLEDIGGFATGVITEDMATGMLLQTGDQKTVFVNETLAVGLAPETYADLLKQRDRWCRGNIQVMRKWNPMKIKGLSLMQRLLYMDGINYWFFGVYKMIFLLAPMLFLIFSIYSLNADFETLVLYWLPAFVSSQLAFRLMSDQKRTVLWSHVYEVAMAPYMAVSVITEAFLRKNIKFNVTAKGIQNARRQFLWRVSIPYLALLALTFIALARVVLHFTTSLTLFQNEDVLYINIFWILYNAVALVLALMVSVERPRFRGAERHKVDLEGTVSAGGRTLPCKVLDLSETGVRFEVAHPEAKSWLSQEEHFILSAGPINGLHVHKLWVGGEAEAVAAAGGKFQNVTLEQYRSLIQIMFLEMTDIYTKRIYERSSLGRAFLKFFRGTEKQPAQAKRMAVREQVNMSATVKVNNVIYEAVVKDYSMSGCRVQVKNVKSIQPGDVVYISGREEHFPDNYARTQWIQQRGRKTWVGMQFLQESISSRSSGIS